MATMEFMMDPTSAVMYDLDERNRLAEELIESYANNHGWMDVGVGIVGMIPGAGIPALFAAIGLQGPVIYKPMARKLANIYLVAPEDLSSVNDDIIETNLA